MCQNSEFSTGLEPCGCVEKAGGVDLSCNVTGGRGELCRGLLASSVFKKVRHSIKARDRPRMANLAKN